MFRNKHRHANTPACDDRHCYLFLHIAKCGGSSIIDRLVTLGQRGVHLYEESPSKTEARRIFREKLDKQQIAPSQIRAVYGHRVFTGLESEVGRSLRLAFFLREPVSMVVSVYNYFATVALDPNNPDHQRYRTHLVGAGNRLIPFREWLEGYPVRNLTMNFLYHAVAGERPPGDSGEAFSTQHLSVCKAAIDTAHFVGFFESLNEDGPAFLRMVGVDDKLRRINVSRKSFALRDDPSVRRLIEEQNAFDCELYHYAVKQRGQRAFAA
jgi:hypothetical protein